MKSTAVFSLLIGVFFFSIALSELFGPIATIVGYCYTFIIAVFAPLIGKVRTVILLSLEADACLAYYYIYVPTFLISTIPEIFTAPIVTLVVLVQPIFTIHIAVFSGYIVSLAIVRLLKIRERVGIGGGIN